MKQQFVLGLAAWGADWALKSDWIIRLFSRTVSQGGHHYQFRYYPWEVAVGCVIMVVGLFLLIAIWRKNPNS